MRPLLRRAVLPAVVVLAGLGLLTGRVLVSSRAELGEGRAALARGDREAAVVHLRRAAHWYAPGSPFVTEALDELRHVARQAEMEGQEELALAAYRAIRTSCIGTRSFYTPHEDRLREANRRIAALMARASPRPPMDRGKTAAQLGREHYELLDRLEAPNPFWSALAGLAFLGWIVAAFAFVFRGLDAELRLRKRPALLWAGLTALGLALWAVSLLLA